MSPIFMPCYYCEKIKKWSVSEILCNNGVNCRVSLCAKREYTDMVLSAMGEIKRGQFSYIKGLLHLSDEAFLHQMTDPRRSLDDRLRGNYGCFSTIALKLALILAIMDWADAGANQVPHITTAHWSQGCALG